MFFPAAALAALGSIFNLRNHGFVNKGWRNRKFQSTPTQRNHGTLNMPPPQQIVSFLFCHEFQQVVRLAPSPPPNDKCAVVR